MAIKSAGRMALEADGASGGEGVSFAFELEEAMEVLIVPSYLSGERKMISSIVVRCCRRSSSFFYARSLHAQSVN